MHNRNALPFVDHTMMMKNRNVRFLQRFILRMFAILACSPAISFASEQSHITEPPQWLIAPFILLLLAIALMPFINRHVWEKYYGHIALALGAFTTLYYCFILDNPARMLHSGIEYFSFICLIGSLFVVAGGMHINLKGYSTPTRNVILLLIGAVISNFIGTTGASMILIRPYLRNNKYRLHPYHVVFFIFIVSNIGGALTPIGDPPLFLGYLRGVPFFWVIINVWYIWLIAIALIVGIFWVLDEYFFRKVPKQVREQLVEEGEKTKLTGMHNWIFIVFIITSVFITDPPFLREAIMILAAVASYFTTRNPIHESNDFNFSPIKEVALLFVGIFATMVPALDWLELNSAGIGIQSPGQFYWAAGVLSSFLDNAPTYLNFLSAAIGLFVDQEMVRQVQSLIASHGAAQPYGTHAQEIQSTFEVLMQYHATLVAQGSVPLADVQVSYLLGNHPQYIISISVASVFFGACTYIGNGPNFMVKSISEQFGARVPSFIEYIYKFTLPILLPIFFIIWFVFFR